MSMIFTKDINNPQYPFIKSGAEVTISSKTANCIFAIFKDDENQQTLICSPNLIKTITNQREESKTAFNNLTKEQLLSMSKDDIVKLLRR